MYGQDIGELKVYTEKRGITKPFETLLGQKGNSWLKAEINVILQVSDRVSKQASLLIQGHVH